MIYYYISLQYLGAFPSRSNEFITCIHRNIHIARSCWAHFRFPKCPKGIGHVMIFQLFSCSLMYALCWIFIAAGCQSRREREECNERLKLLNRPLFTKMASAQSHTSCSLAQDHLHHLLIESNRSIKKNTVALWTIDLIAMKSIQKKKPPCYPRAAHGSWMPITPKSW